MDPGSKEAYRNIFDAIRPQPGVSGPSLWFLLGFLLFLALLIGGTAYTRYRRRRLKLEKAFHELSTEKSLTSVEERELYAMACGVTPDQPLAILSSLAAFERGVEDRVPTTATSPASSELLSLLQSLRRKLGFERLPSSWALRHTRQIPPETRLMVGFKRDDEARFCTCVVEENHASGIRVAPLLRTDQEALTQVKSGERLYVRFWRMRDTEYKFRTQLLAGSPEVRDTLLLAHSDDLERVQQRDFFRLRVNLPIALYDLPDPDLAEISQEELRLPDEAVKILDATLVNVSAGGCAIRSEQELPGDALVIVDPDIGGPFSLGGMVCRVSRVEAGDDGLTHYLHYVNATDIVQDRIVRELYRQQLERAAG